MKLKIRNICCIGAGYVGGPTMAVIADKCPHLNIVVVDINEARINQWNSNNLEELPIFEPGLTDIIQRCRGENLYISNEINKNIEKADMVFISVNTPTKTKGIGAGKASDLKWVESSARQVAKFSKGHTIIVEKSTLPVRTAQTIKSILGESKKFLKNKQNTSTFDVLSNPEFLAEGSAINDLINPDRVLIGGENEEAIKLLNDIYLNWVPQEKILKTNIWSSELAKLTANAFLAQRISSINSIGALCEKTGADVREVANAIGTDSRIGSKFLNSGPGFGGSCFKKDILNLVYLCEYFGIPEVGKFWSSVVNFNQWHQNRISKIITDKLFGTLSGKKLVILGFAFKKNTNDTRESSAIRICKDLLDEGAILYIHDPKVDPQQISIDLGVFPNNAIKNNNKSADGSWHEVENLENIFKDADAAVVLTEWDEYKDINWDKKAEQMRSPAWVFDIRSILNPDKVIRAGINFWRIGDGLDRNKKND